jgi:hypothetical protein
MKIRITIFSVILLFSLSSCSTQKRAQWHMGRAVKLNPSLLKANDTTHITRVDTFIREKIVKVSEGIETVYVTVHDTFYTPRTRVIITKTDSSCNVKLKELEFNYRQIDTLIIKDTIPCPQKPSIIYEEIKNPFREKIEGLLNHIFTFIIGGLFGIILFNYVIRNSKK